MRERRGQAAKRERTAVTAERAADRQQRKRGTQERGVLVEAGDLRSNCERCVLGVGGSDGHATELSGPYAAQKHGCMIHERRNTPQASEASRQAERRTGGGWGLAVKLRAVCVQNVYCPLRRRCAVSRRSCDRGPKCIQVICNVRDNSVLGEPLELLQPCRSLAALHLLVNACWCQQRDA